MTVADKDLCEELYKLSGWHDLEQYWEYYPVTKESRLRKCALDNVLPRALPEFITPAYDSGYLLRKLPVEIDGYWLFICPVRPKKLSQWAATYTSKFPISKADTPENALTKLAIQLFKEGVLK